jgi:hypothetical protein
MSDALEALLLEVRKNNDLSSLHPLKLDRWHRALVGLPPAIYMQYGCLDLWQQVGKAATALETMVSLLGAEGLPVTPHELAQRTIQTFRWYVASTPLEATLGFQASWDKKASNWRLALRGKSAVIKSVPTLKAALEKSKEWADSLEPESEEIHEETPDEG